MDRIQSYIWSKLCGMEGEEVARAFTDYYGDQLMDSGFYGHLVDEGCIDDDLDLLSSDDEED